MPKHEAQVSRLAWWRASRPASQLYVALPLLLGQLLCYGRTGRLDVGVAAGVAVFGIFDQLFIVYANDLADVVTDRRNRTFTAFSGGSRVLADGLLMPSQLRAAAYLMMAGTLGTACLLAVLSARPWLVPLAAGAVALLWMYSYRPFALSYRGGGELLQTLGLGIVLPVFGYYAQAGDVTALPWPLLLALLPAQLACAIATALPDEPSDREDDKRTFVVRAGGRQARSWIAGLLVLAALASITALDVAELDHEPVYPALGLAALAAVWLLTKPDAAPGSRTLALQIGAVIAATLVLVGGMAITGSRPASFTRRPAGHLPHARACHRAAMVAYPRSLKRGAPAEASLRRGAAIAQNRRYPCLPACTHPRTETGPRWPAASKAS